MPGGSSERRGLLVAVEGIDGAGKSTIVQKLAEYCEREGIACVASREPTKGKWGSRLRESASTGRLSLEEELELFIKDRKQHVNELIEPALSAGKVVLLDRYYFSTAAYQGARGADARQIIAANEQFAPRPDLVLLLDLDPASGVDRIHRRGTQRDEFEAIDYQMAVRAVYLSLHDPHIRVINAMRPAEEVLSECLAHFIAAREQRSIRSQVR